jgi:hypothetical protein
MNIQIDFSDRSDIKGYKTMDKIKMNQMKMRETT